MSADEKLYIERLDYQAFDLAEQLALFTSLRRHAARILRAQPAEAWLRTAVHSESGLVTLRQLVLQARAAPAPPPAVPRREEGGAWRGQGVNKVNLREKLALFGEQWSPKVVGELNGQQVKLVKFKGQFVWHNHDGEDELFLVVRGRFRMEFRDRHVWLEEGEFLIVPRGVEHRPVADEEAHVLLFEPATTLNTGDVRNERTVDLPGRI